MGIASGASIWQRALVTDEQPSSLRRALELLDGLASDDAVAHGGWRVNRLAAHVSRDKSQVSRTLRVFADAGFVERDPESMAYRIGWHVFALAARAADQRLLAAGAPILRRLVEKDLGERIHLSVLRGSEVLTVLTQSPPHAVQTVAWAGSLVPAHNTSSGRALLIDLEREELERIFAGVVFGVGGPNAPRNVAELSERIRIARRSGYAIVDEEFEPGLVAAAAPVRDFRGDVIAALNVSAPKFRLRRRLIHAGQAIKAAADELSGQLGWDGMHPGVLGAGSRDGRSEVPA
ncbi:MAG: IclR family transcriptional regulator [Chloroflexi bacterium]|nr:IclR family transcriptional regulator [Chloroflexota bacterium]